MSKSWKQYGGVRKVEQFQSLSIGTLVADQVLLREKYSGSLVFGGSIAVKGDAITGGSVYSTKNIYSFNDVNVGRNIYLANKIFFGFPNVLNGVLLNLDSYSSPTLPANEPSSYAYLNGKSTGIGINTDNPSSALEITGTSTTQNDILTVSSQTSTNRSIISQNSAKKGIVVTATAGLSYIDFFNSATTSSVNTPDARLQSMSSTFTATASNITLSSSGQNILSSGQNTLSAGTINNITSGITTSISSINTNIASSSNTNIYSGNNTDILSKLRIASRFLNNPTALDSSIFYKETAQIYDISSGNYAYNLYENTVLPNQTGNALTLISNDTSSNTFLNWVTPKKNGFAIGGGSFVNDPARNMGTLGLLDVCGNYTPAQTIVSGTNKYRLQSTLGINTYSPRTDSYALDINGPVHLTNGEINKVLGTTFEIQQMSFAKNGTLKTTGIAVGTASTTTVNKYQQFITYTNNGGKTWALSRVVPVSSDSNLEEFPGNNFCIYTYDNSFAIIGTVNSLLFFTVNGGQTWTSFTFPDTTGRIITNVFIANTGVSSQRVFISFSNQTVISNQVAYFNTNYSTLSTSNTAITLLTTITVATLARSIDGYGNNVYFANSGIQSYNVTTGGLNYTTNASNSYNHINAFDSTRVVAVGQSIISYTTNGTNWNNITSIAGVVGPFTLNHVYIFDLNNAIAVGSNGLFVYSTNWTNGSWSIVPNEILNASGISGRINGSTNTLRNVFMYDLNTIIITRLLTTFSTGTSTLGSSNIYYGFLPNLFNRTNNNVFDVCGNMTMAGDINIVDSGEIKTTNASLYVGNQSTLQQLYLGSNNTKTIITGDVSLNGNLSLTTQPVGTFNNLGATTKFVQNQITFLQENPSLVNPNIIQNINLQTPNSTIFGNGNIKLTPSGGNVVHITSGLVVDGSINIMGDVVITNTNISFADELDISVNTPFGPAVKATQYGLGDIANFMHGDLSMVTINRLGLSIGAGVKPPRYTLDVSGLAVLSSYLGVGVTSINSGYSLDISGNMNSSGTINNSGDVNTNGNITINGGCIFQF